MAQLIIRLPDHGLAIDDLIYVSWLDANYFVRNTDISGSPATMTPDSFMIGTSKQTHDAAGATIVPFTDGFDAIVTDGYVRLITEGETTDTVTGLDHLDGELVTVTSGGEIIATETVVGGEITIPISLFTYQVGLSYSAKIRTMRLASPQTGSALQGVIKRINRTTLRYVKTKTGQAGQEYPVTDNDGNEIMTEFLTDLNTVFDTDSRDTNIPVEGGNSTDAFTVIRSDQPFPMTVIASVVEFSIEETR